MIISFADDFDPEKIIRSGQCFRAVKMGEGRFQFITKTYLLDMTAVSPYCFEVNCTREIWDSVWHVYFDLDRSYAKVRSSISEADPFIRQAAEEGRGIRILRQNPWETLLSFIISQRKSIPSIRQAVEGLSMRYGKRIENAPEPVHAFPEPEELQGASLEDFQLCKLGYRSPYLLEAVQRAIQKPCCLSVLEGCSDEEMLAELMDWKGVGIKVASCVALFAYGRTGVAPVDTWMKKIIDKEYASENRFAAYGETAGIMQQYAFYYALNHKERYR